MPWLNELADGYPVVLAGDFNCLPNYGAAHTALVLPSVADSLVSVALTAVFLIETYHSTHIACTICKHARTILPTLHLPFTKIAPPICQSFQSQTLTSLCYLKHVRYSPPLVSPPLMTAAITLVGSNSCCHGAWRDNWSYVGDGMGLTFCPG